MNFLTVLKGFVLMCSLLVAIGPQNAFMLRQAVRREHAWMVAAIMLFGDITMVSLGGFGIGHLLEGLPWVKLALTAIGALYVLRFGVMVFREMMHPKALQAASSNSRKSIITSALAVTFLNPHAIFDTVILVGTLALQFKGGDKIGFMIGTIMGSTVWFFGIAWIGQRLAPYLARPVVWRVIDGFIYW